MENKRKYCVYKHTFPNGKVYVGITKQKPEDRWRHDGVGYMPKNNNCSRIWNAIQKYGWENVEHEILIENLTEHEAKEKEKFFIALCKSNDKKFGYNISPGGETNEMSAETRKKLSDARKGKNYGMVGENAPFYGMHHTDEAKRKISEAFAGENHPLYGTHRSEETKEKILVSNMVRCTPISQYDLSGNFIASYRSIREASRKTGINRSCIAAALNGSQKTAGKCVWREDNNLDGFSAILPCTTTVDAWC